MILVTAANGNQGKLLVPKLVAAGLDVRAVVQSSASAARLRAAGVDDVVVGDISDSQVLRTAMRGVRKVYHVGPSCTRLSGRWGSRSSTPPAPRASSTSSSARCSTRSSPISSSTRSSATSRSTCSPPISSSRSFSPRTTCCRSSSGRRSSAVSWALERRQSLVDLDDVTDVAVMALTDSARHAAATYELVSPGRYTTFELGAIISTVVGRPIAVEEIDADTYAKAWLGDRDPADSTHQLAVLRSISSRYSAHDFLGNPNVLTWLLGREPTSYGQFVRREWNTHQEARA